MPTSQLATNPRPATDGQRVSCPSCGHFLFEVLKVEPASGVTIRIKCKGGHCHKFCDVELGQGRLAVTLATA